MTQLNNSTKWDVSTERSNDQLTIQLVEAILAGMAPEVMRSHLFHQFYLQFQGLTEEQLGDEADRRGIKLT